MVRDAAGQATSTTSAANATATACPRTRSHTTERIARCVSPRWTSPSTPPGSTELRNCDR